MKIPFLATLVVLASAATLRAQTASGSPPGTVEYARTDSSRPIGMLAPLPTSQRGVAVTTVDVRDSKLVSAPSLPMAIQGRVPGASVSQGPGFLGSTSR